MTDASQFPGINKPNTAPTQEMKDAATAAGYNYVDTPTGWTLSNTVNGQQNFSGITSTANDTGGLVYQYTGTPAIADSAQHQNDLANLQALGADVGNISYDRNAQLAASAKAEAAAKFAPLIGQATEQKRQGMATSTVRAGQAGGFENTQQAGVAAISPTVGADWTGTGGKLEATKSAYDLNISNLQAQQAQYEAASLSALRQAEKDGNQTHFDNALKLYQAAQQSAKDVADLQNAKDQHLATLQNIQNQQVTMQQNQQDLVTKHLDTFASGSLIIDPTTGDISLPDIATIKANAATLGVTPQQLTASLRKQQASLSAMSADQRKTELEIQQAQKNLLLTEKPVTEVVDGNLLQFNPKTNSWTTIYSKSTDPSTLTVSEKIALKDKGYTVDSNGNLVKSTEATTGQQESAKSIISSIDTIENHKGLNSAVGINSFARGEIPVPLPFGLGFKIPYGADYYTGANADFIGQVQKMVDTLNLNKLIEVKGQGATFGALSDNEGAMLKRAATPINEWAIQTKDPQTGQTKIVGYKIDEASFKRELDRIKTEMQGKITPDTKQSATPTDTLNNYYTNNPDKAKYIENLIQQGKSDEDVLQILGIKTEPLSMGENGSAQKLAQAIKQVESGGNYNAKGGSGEGGAYQFMPSSWKAWAGQYLGDANAPMTPENQDKVAQAKIQDLLNQGHSPREVALIWNGGQPVAKKGVNRFGVKYDSGAYADKVTSTLKNLG